MFDVRSLNSVSDFAALLHDDSSSSSSSLLLKDLVEELDKQEYLATVSIEIKVSITTFCFYLIVKVYIYYCINEGYIFVFCLLGITSTHNMLLLKIGRSATNICNYLTWK